jgi:hypothetical protein
VDDKNARYVRPSAEILLMTPGERRAVLKLTKITNMVTSKNKESEIKFVIPLIMGCAAAIIISHIVYWTEFLILTNDSLFIILDVVGLAGFLLCAWLAWKHREGGKENATRWATILIAAFICIWVGAWCAQYRQDSRSGIEYKYDKS